MKGHHLPVRTGMLLAGIVVLIAGHGTILYFFASHTGASFAVVSGVIVLIVIKHLGLLAPLCAVLRGNFRRKAR